ncbi:hypothetical protein HG462_002745 [Candidatus Saccharibacteria bacterium]|nr:hypothetical protein [Candidatus Saccharibacteria bacterium]
MNFQKIYDYFFSNNYMTKMPTFGEVLASNVITLLLLLIILGLYIAGKVLLMKKIYGEKKMWQGAIPVLGLMKLYDAVELNKLFAISILIPVLGLIPYFIFCYKLPAAFGEKQPAFPFLTIFFSPIIMLMLATDQKYEYQYVRGKNVPFQGAFALNNTQAPTEAPAQPASEVSAQSITEPPVQTAPEMPAQPVVETQTQSVLETPAQPVQGTVIESQSPSTSENQVQSSDLNNLQ